MTNTPRILIVEDKPSEREAIARVLRIEKYDVLTAANPKEAIEHLQDSVALVVSDLRMGPTSGLDLLRYWKQKRRETPFIMITAHGDVDTAVEAMKLGAEDYLTKPVNPDELLMLIAKCMESVQKDQTIDQLSQRLDRRLGFEKLIGGSAAMLETFDRARRAAATDSTVLITGESGTGKELIAEAIHQNSPRKQRPFVTVNMAAVPEHLVESELFGHVKGSFTGATDSREGRFAAADGGTLFIDEIGDFKLESQAKLLRVLESHTVTPIGSNRDQDVDVRVVAATSRHLEQLVREGDFREDLYYRLNVVNINLPPLRERREDIPHLVHHFVEAMCEKLDRPVPELTPGLKQELHDHDWPGNVRQLKNCIESMLVLSSGDSLDTGDIPSLMHEGPGARNHVSVPAGTKLDELEREAVEQTLQQCGGNRTKAAELLGISVRTLQRKLKVWDGQANGDGGED